MKSIDELRTTIATDLKAHLPELKACSSHPGRFDLAELKRLATRAPAVFAACLGVPNDEALATEERDLTVALAAFVLTKDRPGLARDVAALNLAEALLLYIPGNRWELDYVHPAVQVRADNLYSGAIDKNGVALWAVTWRQTVRLGTDVWTAPGGTLPSELYAGLVPDIGAGHEPDYVQVQG